MASSDRRTEDPVEDCVLRHMEVPRVLVEGHGDLLPCRLGSYRRPLAPGLRPPRRGFSILASLARRSAKAPG